MYPQEYLDYLIYFHAQRDYFECHEVLEEYWKKEKNPALRKEVWVGLIQIAVALYHQRRNNYSGSLKMMTSSLHILQKEKNDLEQLGINSTQLIKQLQQRIKDIKHHQPYEDLSLPLKDDLLQTCKQLCQSRKLIWGKPSDLENKELIHKHRLRDRSEIIKERERQIRLRKNNL